MRAAVLYRVGERVAIEELELDGPCAGEVLVRLAASGVCHSDLHNQQGVHPPPAPRALVTRCSRDDVSEALNAMETGLLARSVILYDR